MVPYCNNIYEHAIHRVIMGRKTCSTDNEPSGNRSLEPHAWLTDVLTRLPEWPEERLAELLPLEGFTFFG
ncbi:hypothetical protein BT09F28_04720 [Escherichia coli]